MKNSACLYELHNLKGHEERDGDHVGQKNPHRQEEDQKVDARVWIIPLCNKFSKFNK